MKSQIDLKRLIKRNQKASEAIEKVAGAGKKGKKKQESSNKAALKWDQCKIPFLVVKYMSPDNDCSEKE